MAQPRLTKNFLDSGDQPNKVAVIDSFDRLPDARADYLRNLVAEEVDGAIASGVSIPAENVYGAIDDPTCTIRGENILTTAPEHNPVSSASTAQNVPWSGVSGEPTTLQGLGVAADTTLDSFVTVDYVQDNLYRNFEPKVGKAVSKYVPVSSKFKYSWFADAGVTIINEYDQEVQYFIASDGKSQNELFKATKYPTETSWSFVPEPIRPPSITPDEYITGAYSATEDFMHVNIYNADLGTNTKALLYMNNQDDYNTWTRYDLPVTVSRYATFLPSQNRIIDCWPSGTITYVAVFDLTTGAQIGTTQSLYNISHGASDVDYTHSSVSMYSTSVRYHISYYNEKYNNLVIHHSVIGYYSNNTSGAKAYQIKSFFASYDVPSSFVTSGTGTLTPLFPLNWVFFSAPTIYSSSANFRWSYHNRTDTRFQTEKGFWTYDRFETAKKTETGQITSASEIYATQNGVVVIPDSSPWSKSVSQVMVFNDNMMIFEGKSIEFGTRYILAEYEVVSGELTIIPGRWRFLNAKPAGALASVMDLAIDPAFYSAFTDFRKITVSFDNSNNQRLYFCGGAGQPVYEVTFDTVNLLINLTDTGLTFPATPAGYSSLKLFGYDPKTGRYVCIGEKSGENRYYRMVIYSGGTWHESPSFINGGTADASRNARNGGLVGDAAPSTYSNLFVDVDGAYYCNQTFGGVGGTYAAPYNKIVFDGTNFTQTAGSSVNPYSMQYLMSYGNTASDGNTPGYVCKNEYTPEIRIQRLSSGTTAANTFMSVNTSRYFYVVGSSGLAAYVGVQDVFLGGYWSTTPSQAVTLAPNAVNYIYAERDPITRVLSVYSSTSALSNSFYRIRIASVTTNSANPISQEVYEVNEIEVDWDKVTNRPYGAGDVGTYVLAKRNVAGNIARGATVAGSSLETTSIIYNDAGAIVASFPSAGGLTGTWRCMGTYTNTTGGSEGATIWMRIS